MTEALEEEDVVAVSVEEAEADAVVHLEEGEAAELLEEEEAAAEVVVAAVLEEEEASALVLKSLWFLMSDSRVFTFSKERMMP